MSKYIIVPEGKRMQSRAWDQFAADALSMDYDCAVGVNGLMVIEADTYKAAVVAVRGEQPESPALPAHGAMSGDIPRSWVDKEIK